MKLNVKSMMAATFGVLTMATVAARAESTGAAPVVTPTQSVAQADATLERVTRERAVVASTFAAEETVCNDKFFVNNCLDKAKEQRRVALAQLRAEEVEAEHFKRAASVAKRDADLAERARKDAEEFARREAQPPKPARTEEELAPPAPRSGKSVAEREAEHAERLRRDAARTASQADKRAANVAAYEKRQADAARRQEQVAKRLAERQAKAEARAADEKKKADAAAAAAAKKQ